MSAMQQHTLGAFPLSLVGIGVLVLAYVISGSFQPLVARFAIHKGLLDLPDGDRHTHKGGIPRLGGIGVFAAVLIAAGAAASLESAARLLFLFPFIISIGIGATMLFAVGLVDDLIGVRPLMKIVVQSIAAVIVWRYGLRMEALVLPGGRIVVLGLMSLPLVILWIVGLSNAFNLVDGADGLAGGVAVIALVATAVAALVLHNTAVFWCSTALIGAMLGFLRFNLPPARIFLGDSGSLVVGFLLGVLTVKGMTRHDGAVFALGPIFALSYPLLDTGISMLRRWLRGDALSRADGRHIHHQLRKLGMGPRQSLLVLFGLSTLVAALGVSASLAPPEFTIALAFAGAALLAVILVYGARWLQYHELLEAGASLTSAALTGRSRLQDKIYARDIARLIQNAKDTEELCAIIAGNASTFRFEHMQLRLGVSDATPPHNIITGMLAARLWSFDYPIAPRTAGHDPLFLSVWCSVEGGARSAGAERVTQILAPALARWMQEHPELMRASSFANVPRQRLMLTQDGDRTPATIARGTGSRRTRPSGADARRV
jgi:UDP-GlcNAc:undecaprenyl-phosphate GlcNAc-1-phosphate transferase